jgi:hypothetical protein
MKHHLVSLALAVTSLGLASAQHPPPPNTAITIFASVAGTTQADAVYWKEACTVFGFVRVFLS